MEEDIQREGLGVKAVGLGTLNHPPKFGYLITGTLKS